METNNYQYIQHVIEEYISAYNRFDVPGMLINFHPAIVFKNVTSGEVDLITNGVEEFKAQAEKAVAFFSLRKQTITHIEIISNTAEVLIDYYGVLAIDLPNGLERGEIIQLNGKSIFTFENRMITSIEDQS
jgi:hypothetical protein